MKTPKLICAICSVILAVYGLIYGLSGEYAKGTYYMAVAIWVGGTSL